MYWNIFNSNSVWQRFKVKHGFRIRKTSNISEYILQSRLIKAITEYIDQYDHREISKYKDREKLIDSVINRIMRMDSKSMTEFDEILTNKGLRESLIYLKIPQPNTFNAPKENE